MLHITLALACVAAVVYGLHVSMKLDAAKVEFDAVVEANALVVGDRDRMFKDLDELTISYNVLVGQYEELVEDMEDVEEEGVTILESHRDICEDYVRVAKELTRVKMGVAQMYPDARHLYEGDIAAELRAEDRLARNADFEKNRQRRLYAERQEKA